ncbi:MAG: hypothetical protein Q9214_005444, partial [Letrouitia sp. 1 TL-2023]
MPTRNRNPKVVGKPRSGGFHVRTGCGTCKIRRVKCDEGKPICFRCKSTGRVCDGYDTKRTTPPKITDEQTQANRPVAFPIVPGLVSWNHGTEEERRGFEYFQLQTSKDIAFALNSSLDHLILQTSHHSSALRHAAIALGSMGERIRLHGAVSVNASSDVNAQHRFALQQYAKAVTHLKTRLAQDGDRAVDFALLTCFLLVVFEFLQGFDSGCLLHLGSGLKILRENYFKALPFSDEKQQPLQDLLAASEKNNYPKLDPLRRDIVHVFQSLDIQATSWLRLRPRLPLSSSSAVPLPFATLAEATDALTILMTRIYNFRRLASPHDHLSRLSLVPAPVVRQRAALRQELTAYQVRLREFHASQPAQGDAVMVLRVNRKVATLMLATYLEPRARQRLLFGHAAPQFRQVVSLSTFLVANPKGRSGSASVSRGEGEGNAQDEDEDGRRGGGGFGAFLGVIQPLYYTATHTPDRATALKAIELLAHEPAWREGSWHSGRMAEAAKAKVKGLELEGWFNEVEAQREGWFEERFFC